MDPWRMALLAILFLQPTAIAAEARWWKGNLHTHSLWSDGDDYPEMIAAWYRDQGYHFLAFSEHNVLAEGNRWIVPTKALGGAGTLDRYLTRFGADWVEQRIVGGTNQVRLKPLAEYRTRFEEPDRFLLVPSSEITDRHLVFPIHLNATNLRDLLPPAGGTNVLDVMQRNIDAVLAQRRRTGQPMMPHVNHPNFGWAITAEELLQVRGERFFEVYNGHPTVWNDGDGTHAGMEKVWDVALAWRLGVLQLPALFGLAVDDSHHYHAMAIGQSNSGRGWVMVRSRFLTPEAMIHALEAGDFYASSGVTLRDVRQEGDLIRIEIATEPGVTYETTFIGTRRDFDRHHAPIKTATGDALRVTHRYSDDIGLVLATSTSPSPSYRMRGDELYVRARITSTRPKANGSQAGEFERAWVQPILPPAPATPP